jgi:UDP-N-acetylmuramoyl-tripeptide--D-alanyl-D-alanine ligase
LEIPVESGKTATGWSVDSRTLVEGDVFFALRGPNHDGHRYLEEVFRKGAIAAIVDRGVETGSLEGELAKRLWRVDDTLRALQQLASRARAYWGGEVIGVTGSAGKTTTKDIAARMLAEVYRTAKNEGNLNNHVGVPLSLLRLEQGAKIAVLEMGMNHAGEIRALARIAKPRVGVVTNVGAAHMEAFDSIEGVALAKRELIEELPAEGTAVLNADDPHVRKFGDAHQGPKIFFGEAGDAQVRADEVRYSLESTRFRVGTVKFETALTGRHSVSNILAGLAVAAVHEIDIARLTGIVRDLKPGNMRGESFHHQGVLVYNDCYNSNPEAARAMLDVLKETPANRRIAVLGEMLELGRWAEPLHREVGNYVAKSGINVLIGIRGAACYTVDAAVQSGLQADAAFFFDGPREAGRLARKLAQPGDSILFKGSRGVRVELALEEFLAPSQEAGR